MAVVGSFTPAQQVEYDAIDALRVKGMLSCEEKCRKLKTGKVPWSPKLEQAMRTHQFWVVLVKRKEGRQIHHSRVKRLAQHLGLSHKLHVSHAEAVEEREEAHKAYKAIKKEASSHRGKFLEDLAIARAEAGHESAEKILRELVKRERIRLTHRAIKRATKPNQRRALNMVQTIDPVTGRTLDHHTNESIEQACLEENERRFRQSNPTPIQQPITIELLGPDGCTKTATKILETGKIPHALRELDPFLAEFLSAHCVGSPLPHFDFSLPPAAHVQGWKKAREATSSGKSGLHFGHFIAGATHNDISAFEATMSELPWIAGFSPDRWCQGINVMLEKKVGLWIVERLRAILLLEADFSQGTKWLGKEMMSKAEMDDRLAPEQYGSRKHKTAIVAATNKRLTYDLLRQKKQRAAVGAEDARGNYDRIGHVSAGMGMRRIGTPIKAVQCILHTIQLLRHYVRTAFGDSVTYFDADNHSGIPIGGVLQGSGASPTIWALVSTPIFDAMRRRGFGVFLKCPISGRLLHFVGFAFVDDTDLIVTDETIHYDQQSSLFDVMQRCTTFWEGFIWASGGAIVPEKSHWYYIDFDWHQDGSWSYRDIRQDDPPLVVKDHTGTVKPIQRLPVTQGLRTLGVRLAPDGNNRDEFQYLMEQIDLWTSRISTSKLPKHLVWTAFHTGIYRKIAYPLPATTFDREQCQKLMSKLLLTTLPHSQVNRHFPRALVFGPLSSGGLNMPNLYVEQGIQHIQIVTTFGPKFGDITGHLLNASFEQLVLELGIDSNPFMLNHRLWRPLATNCWLTSLWDFLNSYGIVLQVPMPKFPQTRRGDAFLMPLFQRLGVRDPKKLCSINRCRLFLRVARVSDVFSACGRRICRSIWSRQKSTRPSSGCFDWPRQGPPSHADWEIWEQTLRSTFGLAHTSLVSTRQLGMWQNQPWDWDWFVPWDRSRLIRARSNRVFEIFSHLGGTRYSTQQLATESLLGIRRFFPLSQVDVSQRLGSRVILSEDRFQLTWDDLPCPFPTVSWAAHCLHLIRQDCSWAFAKAYSAPSDALLLLLRDYLSDGRVTAVSDGSDKNGIGAAAWIVRFGPHNLSGGFKIPGGSSDIDSYRCEVAGQAAILCLLDSVTKHFHIHNGSAEVASDSLGGLSRLYIGDRPARFSDNHWDMVAVALRFLHRSKALRIRWRHVKGHQDDDPYAELDSWARDNILMDLRAKECREDTSLTPDIPALLHLWRPFASGTPIVRNGYQQIRDHCLGTAAKEYWLKKGKLGSGNIEWVAWDCLGVALEEVHPERRRWVTKHSSGWCGVNGKLFQWNLETDHRCPRCNAAQESATHVWRCKSSEAQWMWRERWEAFRSFLSSTNTCPDIVQMFSSRLRTWWGGHPLQPYSGSFPGMAEALAQQDDLGWDSAVEGRWSSLWIDVQQRWFDFIESRRTGKRWLVICTHRLWELGFDLWEQRNKVNKKRKEEADLSLLQSRVRLEYEMGYANLHARSRRLFTGKTIEQRLQQSKQVL